jgi:hypothetical protein
LARLGRRSPCRFYKTRSRGDISPSAYVQQFAREHAINEAVFSDPRFDLDGAEASKALDRVRRGLEQDATSLEQRVEQGFIVEGHGDLRPEHICLSDPPVIIDCLEFSHALRLVDPFDELGYLTLECEIIDAGWVGERIIEGCAQGLRDRPPPRSSTFTGPIAPACERGLRLFICSRRIRARLRSGSLSPAAISSSRNCT